MSTTYGLRDIIYSNHFPIKALQLFTEEALLIIKSIKKTYFCFIKFNLAPCQGATRGQKRYSKNPTWFANREYFYPNNINHTQKLDQIYSPIKASQLFQEAFLIIKSIKKTYLVL